MAKIKGFLHKNKKWIILVLVLFIIALLIFKVFMNASGKLGSLSTGPQIMKLEKMDVQQLITSTGIIESKNSKTVNLADAYEVTSVLVEPGDKVIKGQRLCELDTTELDQTIRDIRGDLSKTVSEDSGRKNRVQQQFQNMVGQRDSDDVQLQEKVDSAKTALDEAKSKGLDTYQTSVTAAQQALPPLETNHQAASDAFTSEPTEINKLALEAATVALDNAKSNLEQAELRLLLAESAHIPFQVSYDNAVQAKSIQWHANSLAVDAAKEAVSTQGLLDTSKADKIRLETHLDKKKDAQILSPIDGTVIEVNVEKGEKTAFSLTGGSQDFPSGLDGMAGIDGLDALTPDVSADTGNALFVIADTTSLQVRAKVPEYDVVLLKKGMKVEMTSDALLDEVWSGTVIQISPAAVDNSSNFEILVNIESEVNQLAIGMSMNLNVFVANRKNVFAVPFDAIVENEAGKDVVYVYEPKSESDTQDASENLDNVSYEIAVTTGLDGDYYVEIEAPELKEGLSILTDPLGVNVSRGGLPTFITGE